MAFFGTINRITNHFYYTPDRLVPGNKPGHYDNTDDAKVNQPSRQHEPVKWTQFVIQHFQHAD